MNIEALGIYASGCWKTFFKTFYVPRSLVIGFKVELIVNYNTCNIRKHKPVFVLLADAATRLH